MKRIISAMLLVTTFVFTLVVVSANTGTVNVRVHFQNWTGDYEGIGAHAWGDKAEPMENPTGTDDFGIYFDFENIATGTEIGFIAVDFVNGAQNWNAKHTGDVKIDTTEFDKTKTNHVYVFQGADSDANAPGYYVADNAKYNLLLVYADPAEQYEENLGVHSWNLGKDAEGEDVGGPAWGTPDKVFTNGSSHATIKNIKVAMISSTNEDLGMLIYAGGDGNKKTGDVTYKDALGDKESSLGTVAVAYVYNAGDAVTDNSNLFNNVEDFVEAIFAFNFVQMSEDGQGGYNGTYAPRKNQIIAQTSLSLANPLAKEDADEEEALAELISWFTVTQVGGGTVEINDVHVDKGAKTISSFVLILSSDLDNTKQYNLSFNLGLEGDENKTAEIAVNMDTEGPKLTFISPASFAAEKDPTKRVILVAWNKKFDQNLFPRFIVTDDRDGDVTSLVYVPKGEFSKLNTNVEGDYTIMLRVSDSWGNVTEETFIFRVTRKVK